MEKHKKQIAVIGGRNASRKALNAAETIGKLIAKNDWQLICGGLGGIMEAACRGARSENGTTIGIVPSNRRTDANEFVTVPVGTGLGIARNSIIAHSADGAIAIAGRYGTLSEIAYFLQLGKPVITLHCGWEVKGVFPAKSPKEAIKIIAKSL